MAVKEYGPRSSRWRQGGVQFGPFEAGLNLRDSGTEIAPNELADGTNLTLDERGVAIKRNDCPTSVSFPTPPIAVEDFYYSEALSLGLIAGGTSLYKAALGAGAWTLVTNALVSGRTAMVDFSGKVWLAKIDVAGTQVKVHTCDGTNVPLVLNLPIPIARDTASPVLIASWQNKVWVANGIRLWYSSAGGATFVATDFVDLRDKDDLPLTALFGGSGLLAFKERATARVNDSTTGAYQTIDWNTGCVGPLAVCGSDEGIFVWGIDGLYRGNGFGPFTSIGDKLRPRFLSTNINATTKTLIAAVYLNGRVYFAFPRTSATIPDAIMEYNPRVGWLMEAYLTSRVGPFAQYRNASGIPTVSFASASAAIKDLYTSTTRTGFAASLTSGYVEPFGGYLGRVASAHPQLTVPASASLQFGINYLDPGGVSQSYTNTVSGPTAGGTFRPRLQPKSLGSAFAFTVNDTASPLASLSILGCELSAVLTSLR